MRQIVDPQCAPCFHDFSFASPDNVEVLWDVHHMWIATHLINPPCYQLNLLLTNTLTTALGSYFGAIIANILALSFLVPFVYMNYMLTFLLFGMYVVLDQIWATPMLSRPWDAIFSLVYYSIINPNFYGLFMCTMWLAVAGLGHWAAAATLKALSGFYLSDPQYYHKIWLWGNSAILEQTNSPLSLEVSGSQIIRNFIWMTLWVMLTHLILYASYVYAKTGNSKEFAVVKSSMYVSNLLLVLFVGSLSLTPYALDIEPTLVVLYVFVPFFGVFLAFEIVFYLYVHALGSHVVNVISNRLCAKGIRPNFSTTP